MKNKITAKMLRKLAKELENYHINKSHCVSMKIHNDSINPIETTQVYNLDYFNRQLKGKE